MNIDDIVDWDVDRSVGTKVGISIEGMVKIDVSAEVVSGYGGGV